MKYGIESKRIALKSLKKLPKSTQIAISEHIQRLSATPYEDCEKLEGFEDLFRVRVGLYRIVYQIQKDRLVILIVRIGHRSEVYKRLGRG